MNTPLRGFLSELINDTRDLSIVDDNARIPCNFAASFSSHSVVPSLQPCYETIDESEDQESNGEEQARWLFRSEICEGNILPVVPRRQISDPSKQARLNFPQLPRLSRRMDMRLPDIDSFSNSPTGPLRLISPLPPINDTDYRITQKHRRAELILREAYDLSSGGPSTHS